MGYYAHDTVVAFVGERRMEQVRAFRDTLPEEWRPLLIETHAMVNGGSFWTFVADGSKEGWNASNEGDEHRESFRAFLRDIGAEFAAIRWGGDHCVECGVTVEDHG